MTLKEFINELESENNKGVKLNDFLSRIRNNKLACHIERRGDLVYNTRDDYDREYQSKDFQVIEEIWKQGGINK